jgi:GH24 family phage-related lysozyme (muramidase)
MKPEVREQFPAFTAKFEGRIPWLYLDVKGLVTIGLGCLCDSVNVATSLPFVDAAGNRASTAAIEAEWRVIKAHTELAQKGAGAARKVAQLRLPEEAIDNLARQRLEANELILLRYFPDFDSWPAPAQLGVLSMAWAMGAGFPAKWPHFADACRARDWDAASASCKMREEGNPGLVPRNRKDAELFLAAGALEAVAPALVHDDSHEGRVAYLQALWFDDMLHAPHDGDDPEPAV